MARDLLAALWPASYKGVPIYLERSSERFGRRLAVHQFYRRDDPYVQDLGAEARHYDCTIYLAGESYDSAAESLVAAMVAEGAGTLVLPVQGPRQARLETCERESTLDRTGYIAFHAHFVREGAASALASVTYFAQLAFDGVATLAGLAGAATARLDVAGRPGWIVGAAVDGLGDTLAGLETIRAEANIDPTTSAALGRRLADAYAALPVRVDPVAGLDPATAPTIAALAVDLADAMPPQDAMAAFGDAFDAVEDPAPVDPARSQNARTAAANADAIAHVARLAFLAAWVEALMRATYDNRPQGITARAECVERFDVVIAAAVDADGVELMVALQDLRGTAVDYLSTLIADLAPIVTVTTQVERPSIVLAWELYGDPSRAADLVARNGVKHPSFMPTQFEALAPAAGTLLPVAA